MLNNNNIIIDATHLSVISREYIVKKVVAHNKCSINKYILNALYVNSPLSVCKERLEYRNVNNLQYYIPLEIIEENNEIVTIPSKNEGFDNIYIINN
jgi:hypothetical protein